MKLILSFLFFFCFFFCFLFSFGQQDSVDRKIFKAKLDFDLSDSLVLEPFDSTLSRFYYVEEDGRSLIASLGCAGLSNDEITFKYLNFGFSDGENILGNYYEKYSKDIVFKTNTPVARISYINGAQALQDFDLLFSQNISSRLNMALRVGNYSSTGFYLNQDIKQKLFSIQSNYFSRNKKYGFFLKYSVNSGIIAENGGIKGDSLYKEAIDGNKLGVQVWLENSNNRYDKREVNVKQFFDFGKMKDTLDGGQGRIVLGLNSRAYVNDIWFEDNLTDSVYYNRFGVASLDSNLLVDKARNTGVQNALFLKLDRSLLPFKFTMGVSGNGYKVENLYSDTNLLEGSVFTKIGEISLGSVIIGFEGNLGFAGYNQDGYHVKADVEGYLLNEMVGYSFSGAVTRNLPSYKALSYSGSNLSWENNFSYVNQKVIEGKVILPKFGITLNSDFYGVSNYVYINSSDASPNQFGEEFWGYKLSFTKAFNIKKYHLDVTLMNQGVDETAPVNLPEWLILASFYYQRHIFKEALELRYGIDYWQSSAYHANDYLPFTRSFGLQESYLVGDYPFVNFYISARIKSAQGFVNFQNLAQTFLDKSYMMTPYYPMQDFSISFGIRWDFYN